MNIILLANLLNHILAINNSHVGFVVRNTVLWVNYEKKNRREGIVSLWEISAGSIECLELLEQCVYLCAEV